jgi:hypothetical protein
LNFNIFSRITKRKKKLFEELRQKCWYLKSKDFFPLNLIKIKLS